VGLACATIATAPFYALLGGLGVPLALPGAIALAIGLAALAIRRAGPSIDGFTSRHRAVAAVWVVLTLAGGVELVRVSHFMVDAKASSYSAPPADEFYKTHNCLTAYYRAATLTREPNLYDVVKYMGRDDDPNPMIGPFTTDPFEYPPPFVVPARAALAVSSDFFTWRSIWFAIELALLIAAVLAVARYVGDGEGGTVALLSPTVVLAIPTLLTAQMGNYQLFVYALTALVLVARERGRSTLAGALLAFLTVTKLFPGLLVIYLVGRRDWRAVWSFVIACAVMCGIALAVLGLDPYRAFLTYQLPRMADGSAFPWLQGFMPAIAVNHSVFGIVIKLHAIGVPGMSFHVAGLVAWLYTVGIVVLAYRLGRRATADRLHTALVWLALLQLAALRSPFTPDVYAVLGPLWMISLLVVRARPMGRMALAGGWLALNACIAFVGVGAQMGDHLRLALTAGGQLVGFAITIFAIVSYGPASTSTYAKGRGVIAEIEIA
jgi:hypothetical protein